MTGVESFYDALADDYHLVYADWQASVWRQGEVLDRLIRSQLDISALTVLDCSCGIGTQAIGLALRGYTVSASDLSASSIDRARREATRFGVDIPFAVADMRALGHDVPGTFDIVLSCDNSLPHLLGDDDLRAAITNMRQKLKPGGMIVIGIRDYDQLVRDRPPGTMPAQQQHRDERTITFQLWDWDDDGRSYTLNLFVMTQRDDPDGTWVTQCHTTRYRALLRHELDSLLSSAGFSDVQWHDPRATGYHQPLVTARAISAPG